jgi:hypothetical protein
MSDTPRKYPDPESLCGYQTHYESWDATFQDDEIVEALPAAEPEQPPLPEALIPVPLAELGLDPVTPSRAAAEPGRSPERPKRPRRDSWGPRVYLAGIAVIGAIFLLSTWRFIRVQNQVAKNRQIDAPAVASLKPDPPAQPAAPETVQPAAPAAVAPPAAPEAVPPAAPVAVASPAAVASSAAAASPATIPHRRHHQEEIAPSNLEFVIKNELAQEDLQNIGVSVSQDGDVYLHGDLSDRSQEDQVVAVVHAIPGVGQIHFIGTVEVPEETTNSTATTASPTDSIGEKGANQPQHR